MSDGATTIQLKPRAVIVLFSPAKMERHWPVKQTSAHYGCQSFGLRLAGSRVFVHRDVRDEFVEKLVNQIKRIRIGDPINPATQLGAQASRAQFARVNDYLNVAFREGAIALTGGRPARVEGLEKGLFIEPTILDNVENHMRIAREEVFGPVTCLMTWNDEDDVIRQANDSPYGLAGGV